MVYASTTAYTTESKHESRCGAKSGASPTARGNQSNPCAAGVKVKG